MSKFVKLSSVADLTVGFVGTMAKHYEEEGVPFLRSLNIKPFKIIDDDMKYDYWFTQFDFPDENGKPYRSSGGEMVWNDQLKREIPKGWSVDNLYSIAEPINGLACQKYRPKESEAELPVVKIKEMHEGITADTEKVSASIPEKHKIFDGDILFSWSATLEVMYWFGGDAGLNQHIFKVVPINGFSKEYVYHQFSAYVINFVKMAEARKTTMGHITTDHLEQSRIALPPSEIIQVFSKIVQYFLYQIENEMSRDCLCGC